MNNYFFIDWIAMLFLFIAMWQLGNRKKSGYIYNAISCILWIFVSIKAHSHALTICNVVIFILCIKGYIQWTKSSNKS